MTAPTHQFIFANCLGFCGGVKRALELFQQKRRETDQVIYVLHELVHNNAVTASMQAQNCRIVSSPDEIPQGAIAMIGAHGVTIEIEKEMRRRAALLLDATCPVVKALQRQASMLHPEDDMVVFGKKSHPETAGVISYSAAEHIYAIDGVAAVAALPDLHQPVLFCQTTLSCREADAVREAMKQRFPSCRYASHCCNASHERQAAIEALLPQVDAIVIVGSANSSNANRLCEIGRKAGRPSWLIDAPKEIPAELSRHRVIGIGAGASTPQSQIDIIVAALSEQPLEP